MFSWLRVVWGQNSIHSDWGEEKPFREKEYTQTERRENFLNAAARRDLVCRSMTRRCRYIEYYVPTKEAPLGEMVRNVMRTRFSLETSTIVSPRIGMTKLRTVVLEFRLLPSPDLQCWSKPLSGVQHLQ